MAPPQKADYRPSYAHLVFPFWLSKKNWLSWLLLAFLIANMFGTTSLYVWANTLDGQLMDALVARKWDGLWQLFLLVAGVGAFTVLVSTFGAAVSEFIEYHWRSWMTDNFLKDWTHHRAYYEIEREGDLQNADQRIAEDIQIFVQSTLNTSTMLLGNIVRLVSFTAVLWAISGTLRFTLWGRDVSIPGYMVYIVYAYSLGGLLVTHVTGHKLVGLTNEKQGREADFRFLGMQVRENAEQISFYNGGAREYQRLWSRFQRIRENWKQIIITVGVMTASRDFYFNFRTIIATLSSMPRYLAGLISLGDVTRVAGAFNAVGSSLEVLPQAYQGFSVWLAVGNRLRDLSAAMAHASYNPRGILSRKELCSHIEVGALTIGRPNGEILAEITPFTIHPGERWLIRGQTGAGKSTLLRAIAGMWPHGNGTVTTDESAEIMFLPQRSYIPEGTLKAALCYPAEVHLYSDDQCRDVLEKARLVELKGRLAEKARWQQILSGGEQQRLAIARALLHKPDYLFLDEATSALDGDTEGAVYGTLLNQLPDTALISVAHRASLAPLHRFVLEVKPGGITTLTDTQ